MHTVHGSSAFVSATGTTSGGNGVPSALQKHHHSSSRSGSLSSASVVTIKRPASVSSSSTGARNSAVPMRSQSPSETSLVALRVGREHLTPSHKRRKSVAVDPTERASTEGLDTLDRWSHSTNSSVASIGKGGRSRGSSGAILASLTDRPFSPQQRSRTTVDYSPRASPVRQPTSSRPTSRRQPSSPAASPERAWRGPSRHNIVSPITALPPLHTTPALIDPNDTEVSPSTLQTIPTPPTQPTYGQDYFGDVRPPPRSKIKSKKPILIRNHTAPMANVNSSRLQPAETAQEAARKNRHSDSRGQDKRDAASRAGHVEQNDEASKSTEKSRHRRSRTRDRGEKDKKAMLSKALQKANTAVLLDNAQNFEGALDAYGDACRLLQQVMDRSSAADDKRKLDAIRVTYSNRIEELRQLEAARPGTSDEKSLPTRPMSDDSIPISPASDTMSLTIDAAVRDSAIYETATVTRIMEAPRLSPPKRDRDSFFSGTMQAVDDSSRSAFDHENTPVKSGPVFESEATPRRQEEEMVVPKPEPAAEGGEESPVAEKKAARVPLLKTQTVHLAPLDHSDFMPAPLSPRRPTTPMSKSEPEEIPQQDSEQSTEQIQSQDNALSHDRKESDASISWLDIIDESGSSSSSVHSVGSQKELRRKHIRSASSNPDFDAAFDAAVEAAYDEGLEPDTDEPSKREMTQRKHAPKESIVVPSSAIKEILSPTNQYHPTSTLNLDPDDEEEERILDDITQDYAQSFNFDLTSKSALPRQSDSSGYSRSTWQSSLVSDRTTAGTSLSTVGEETLPAHLSQKNAAVTMSINTMLADPPPPPIGPPPTAPPPQGALPRPPSMSQNRMSGVRSRRLSGQNARQLKIETSSGKSEARKRASTFHNSVSPFQEEEENAALDRDFKFGAKLEPTASDTQHEQILKSPPSLDLRSAVSDEPRPKTAATVVTERRASFDDQLGELRAQPPPLVRKNKSSVSLREHTVLISSPQEDSAPSAVTSMSSTYMTYAAKQRSNEAPLTTQRAHFPSLSGTTADGHYSGGIYLFDTSLSAFGLPTSPRSPGPSNGQPSGLEPCPESFLLRPFWLMRGIASTLTHPKGGFLSTRLFVPREVWQTRGVKLKSVEEKVANCDLLTAALGRLAVVDTYDADAVMEELQSFEEVMERVQMAFIKKLGSDVGVSGVSGIFKEASASTASSMTNFQAPDVTAGAEKTKSKESKGYLNSWRKLRSKSSGAPLGGTQVHKVPEKEKEPLTMPSVPMTAFVPVERRGQRKDARNLAFEGPNREYMGSLSRLFEGVQVLGKPASHFHLLSCRAKLNSVVYCMKLSDACHRVLVHVDNTITRVIQDLSADTLPRRRPNCTPSRGPRAQRYLAYARRARAQHSARSRVFCFLCLPFRAGRLGHVD